MPLAQSTPGRVAGRVLRPGAAGQSAGRTPAIPACGWMRRRQRDLLGSAQRAAGPQRGRDLPPFSEVCL
jgi:hypothetical protein